MWMIWKENGEGQVVEIRQTSVGHNPAGGAWTELQFRKQDLERMLGLLDDDQEDRLAQWLRDMLVRNVAPKPLPEGTITKPGSEA